jgi:hypothetical protein
VSASQYRAVVRHVRYWRGQIQRWSTVYPFYGSLSPAFTITDAENFLALDDAMCYALNATDGGTYECDLYDSATGGVPLVTYIKFNWESPGAWVKPSAAAWSGAPPAVDTSAVAEIAMSVTWPGGISKTGKPVKFRKWYHLVPNYAVEGTAADIPTANVTTLTTGANNIAAAFAAKGLSMGNARTLAGSPATVNPYYGNHQMPRGRRRKALVKADGQYTGPHITIPSVPEED